MFTLTLDNRHSLKGEIRAMRQQRLTAEKDYVWNITLQQRTGPILYVRATGPNLWVEEYSIDNTTWHKFIDIDRNFSMNYKEEDRGCLLYAEDIIGLIESFAELIRGNILDYTSQKKKIRNAYVIIVYVSSEMIRNEILEKALDITTYESELPQHTWAELEFLYKNFSTLSTKLYQGDGKNFPTIYIEDFLSSYARVADNKDAKAALGVIGSLGMDINPSLLV